MSRCLIDTSGCQPCLALRRWVMHSFISGIDTVNCQLRLITFRFGYEFWWVHILDEGSEADAIQMWLLTMTPFCFNPFNVNRRHPQPHRNDWGSSSTSIFEKHSIRVEFDLWWRFHDARIFKAMVLRVTIWLNGILIAIFFRKMFFGNDKRRQNRNASLLHSKADEKMTSIELNVYCYWLFWFG